MARAQSGQQPLLLLLVLLLLSVVAVEDWIIESRDTGPKRLA